MGRHSASVDDDAAEDQSAAAVDVVDDDADTAGRHSGTTQEPPVEGMGLIEDALAAAPSAAPQAQPHDETQQIATITDPIVDAPVPEAETQQIPTIDAPIAEAPSIDAPAAEAPAPVPAPAPVKRPHGSSADLALLRHHSDVRARVIAALLVPFVLYTAVLLVIDKMKLSTYLIWIWIPLVTAGVLVGVFLDLGHRRHDAPAPADPS